jgi:hypothetical protein
VVSRLSNVCAQQAYLLACELTRTTRQQWDQSSKTGVLNRLQVSGREISDIWTGGDRPFLQDMEDGDMAEFNFEMSWQTMENPSLRSKYQMSDGQSGIDRSSPPGSPEAFEGGRRDPVHRR